MPLYLLSVDTWMIHVVENFPRQNTLLEHSESVCKKIRSPAFVFRSMHVPELLVSFVCERILDLSG